MSAELRDSYAQLEQRVAERTKELATLNAVAAVVSGSLDLDRILEDSLAITLRMTGMDGGATFRLDDRGVPTLAAHQGLSPEAREFVGGPLLEGWLEWVSATDSATGVLDIDDFSERPLRDVARARGHARGHPRPVGGEGGVLGAMILGSAAAPPPHARGPGAALAAIGGQVGLAAENARLYEHAEESATAAERNRLARDLHDAVSQTLFSAALIAEVLPRIWERDPAEGARRLEELRQLDSGRAGRDADAAARVATGRAGGGRACRSCCANSARRSRAGRGSPWSVEVDGVPRACPPTSKMAFYRSPRRR